MKQFREYNNLDKAILADLLGITPDEYDLYESGKELPTIDMVQSLAKCYKVTVDELYGYTPRLTLHSGNDYPDDTDDIVAESLLRMSNLSWEEMQLIIYYRKNGADDSVIKTILEANTQNKED